MKEFLVPFVIPNNGREQLIFETIESITLQDIDVSLVEVVVVTETVYFSARSIGNSKVFYHSLMKTKPEFRFLQYRARQRCIAIKLVH